MFRADVRVSGLGFRIEVKVSPLTLRFRRDRRQESVFSAGVKVSVFRFQGGRVASCEFRGAGLLDFGLRPALARLL